MHSSSGSAAERVELGPVFDRDVASAVRRTGVSDGDCQSLGSH